MLAEREGLSCRKHGSPHLADAPVAMLLETNATDIGDKVREQLGRQNPRSFTALNGRSYQYALLTMRFLCRCVLLDCSPRHHDFRSGPVLGARH